jgi:hypothetical protein
VRGSGSGRKRRPSLREAWRVKGEGEGEGRKGKQFALVAVRSGGG